MIIRMLSVAWNINSFLDVFLAYFCCLLSSQASCIAIGIIGLSPIHSTERVGET